MVCGEADAACPFVKGAALRVSMPYLDPKIYDDGKFEAAKYAERRDDIGRLMLSVMMQVRNRLGQHEHHPLNAEGRSHVRDDHRGREVRSTARSPPAACPPTRGA